MNKKLESLIGYIFRADKIAFSKIQIEKNVIEDIIQIARKMYPNEFAALLQGGIEQGTLHIDGLIFLPGTSSDEGAIMQTHMLPLISTVGSVHSHPGYDASPSKADLQFFSKRGLVHLIIAKPYDRKSIRAYDASGNLIDYDVS